MAIELERPALSRAEFRALQDPPDEAEFRGYEYDEGRLIPVPPVNGPQSRAWLDLASKLNQHVEQHALGEVWIDMAVYLDPEGRQRVYPEIVFLASDRLHQYQADDEIIIGPPTLVVEVTAVSSQQRDRGSKMEAYNTASVPWYWIADVVSRHTEEYQWADGGYRVISRTAFEDEFRPRLFPDLIIQGIR